MWSVHHECLAFVLIDKFNSGSGRPAFVAFDKTEQAEQTYQFAVCER